MIAKSNIRIFNNCFHYIFKLMLKTSRTYLYLLLIPMMMVGAFYLLTYRTILNNNHYVVISSYVLLPILFNIFLVSHIISEWRESIFLKQLNNFAISRMLFISTLFCVVFILAFSAVWINIGCLFLLDRIKVTMLLVIWWQGMVTFSQWFGFLLAICLTITVVFSLSLLIAGMLKNVYLIQTLNLMLFLVSLLFGDFLLEFNFTLTWPVIIVSYFVPQKYLNWINYIFYSQSISHSYNFFIIVPNVNAWLSFNNIYQPLISVFVFELLIISKAYYRFLPSTKN